MLADNNLHTTGEPFHLAHIPNRTHINYSSSCMTYPAPRIVVKLILLATPHTSIWMLASYLMMPMHHTAWWESCGGIFWNRQLMLTCVVSVQKELMLPNFKVWWFGNGFYLAANSSYSVITIVTQGRITIYQAMLLSDTILKNCDS